MSTQERNQWAFDGVMEWLTRKGASRCVQGNIDGQACVYYNPDTKNRCAIGGHLPIEIAKELGDASIGIQGLLTESAECIWWQTEDDSSAPVTEDIVEKISEFYDGVDDALLDALQNLHDIEKHWDENGLSIVGYSRAAEIAANYGLKNKFVYAR